MAHGVIARPAAGPPPGGPIAPGLAHVSRHSVLDLWWEKRAKQERQGEASRTRWVDEFGGAGQSPRDAEHCDRTRTHRMEQCGRPWAPAQPRRLLCGRVARERAASYGGGAAKGPGAVIRMPSEPSGRTCLARTYAWLPQHRPWRRRDPQPPLAPQRQGCSQACALTRGRPTLERVTYPVAKPWRHAIKRHSQRHRGVWRYGRSRSGFPLPQPQGLHPGW